jgi:hypothetical protein
MRLSFVATRDTIPGLLQELDPTSTGYRFRAQRLMLGVHALSISRSGIKNRTSTRCIESGLSNLVVNPNMYSNSKEVVAASKVAVRGYQLVAFLARCRRKHYVETHASSKLT